MITVETPRGARLPKDVLRALLKVSIWCKDNGYRCRILREPDDDTPPRKAKK